MKCAECPLKNPYSRKPERAVMEDRKPIHGWGCASCRNAAKSVADNPCDGCEQNGSGHGSLWVRLESDQEESRDAGCHEPDSKVVAWIGVEVDHALSSLPADDAQAKETPKPEPQPAVASPWCRDDPRPEKEPKPASDDGEWAKDREAIRKAWNADVAALVRPPQPKNPLHATPTEMDAYNAWCDRNQNLAIAARRFIPAALDEIARLRMTARRAGRLESLLLEIANRAEMGDSSDRPMGEVIDLAYAVVVAMPSPCVKCLCADAGLDDLAGFEPDGTVRT